MQAFENPRFIFLFLDGVGLGPAEHYNPLYPANGHEPLPFLADMLGGALLSNLEVNRSELLLKAVDATLGVPGRPQSATGQATLYTGQNAPAFLGRHLTGFANGSLRTLIEETGLFKQVKALGKAPTSANLYTPGYFEAIQQRKLRYSVGALLNLTADVPFRMPQDYFNGEALFWDITNRYTRGRDAHLPLITPQEAGERLAHLGNSYDVTLFECYLPDFAGHKQDMEEARSVLMDVDGLIQGVVENMASDVTLIICSDHGNIENLSTRLHTLNPVPLLVVGSMAFHFEGVTDLMGITPVIVSLL
ncbi:MAG TPA: alkaline phosphatase family protein [Chloroflexia bacterium]|nr:alkaline phosphatase family protein [Chloroflexia bacterium]